MCTVSVISLSGSPAPHLAGASGFRVVVNRDEERDRPGAFFPRWRTLSREPHPVRAIWPIDPRGGGTWVGAAEHGLVLCLLNRNPEPPPALPPDLLSRGVIIPGVIGARSAAEALDRLANFELDRFAPFRLVAVEPERAGRRWSGGMIVHEAEWDRTGLRRARQPGGPVCFVSSGLGDSAAAPRTPLFRELVSASPSPSAQDAFHRHVWPGREAVSVLMSRAQARTVSITTVEVTPRAGGAPQVRMAYRPVFAHAEAALAAPVS